MEMAGRAAGRFADVVMTASVENLAPTGERAGTTE